jgi:PRTRC genetic system protein B
MKATSVAIGGSQVLNLSAALLIYANHQHRDVFVSAHEITRDGQVPRIGAGVPATPETLARLLAPVARSMVFTGFLPERLLAIGPGAIVWWCPPSPRTIWFRSDGKGSTIGTTHGRVEHPGLVFAAARGRWYVFAVKGTSRPTPETKLWRAPYFNVWADRGEVCVGNVKLPGTTDHTAIADWERAFFESRFTHPNPGFRIRFRGGGYAFWRHRLDAAPGSPFPARVLYPAGKTLEGLVRLITKEESKDED